MKQIIFFILLLPFTLWAHEGGGVGFEAGVSRLSNGSKAIIAPSGAFHFELHTGKVLDFFGQMTSASGSDDQYRFKQTSFTGGIQLELLPVLDVRVGFATSALEIKDEDSKETEHEFGPMAGATVHVPLGMFKLGATGSIIRSESLTSTNMRLVLLLMF